MKSDDRIEYLLRFHEIQTAFREICVVTNAFLKYQSLMKHLIVADFADTGDFVALVTRRQ